MNTGVKDLRQYLDLLIKNTNMLCLTGESALSGDCDFLSANLAAKSLFGEDALANCSLEKSEDGSITGHVRIRSKTQGIALSLGDKVGDGKGIGADQADHHQSKGYKDLDM